MAEPTSVNEQITDALASPPPSSARAELRYVLTSESGVCVELGWGLRDELVRFHVAFIDHEAPCPFVPSGTRLPLTLTHQVELGDSANAEALAVWLRDTLGDGQPPSSTDLSAGAAKRLYSVCDAGNTLSLVWEPGEGTLSLALRCIELPVHVFNDGFSGHSCKISASFELPVSRADAEQLGAWLSALHEPASN